MKIPPPIIEAVIDANRLALQVGHGGKTAIYEKAAASVGISYAQFMRYRKQLTIDAPRKQRKDAGSHALTHKEATRISALLMEHRNNGKKMMSVRQALEILRSTNSQYQILATKTHPETGELTELSPSAVLAALRSYRLHPEQLSKPAPAVQLKSLHPNHVWQIDASMCVLYYLSNGIAGLQVMEKKKFYKNKPKNLERIASDRVWSYEVTDHYSGAIFVCYVMSAESSKNITDSFIAAIQQRDGLPFYGVPNILMMDKGSANTSGMFKNLLKRLQVKDLPHAAENARATGQVEKARDIIERQFESQLRLVPVHNLDELNAFAASWSKTFNAKNIHSRHNSTRFSKWLEITNEQLRIAPEPELCYTLATHTPETRRVTQDITVEFKGKSYDLRGRNVIVGEEVQITYNPYREGFAYLVTVDTDGHETLEDLPEIKFDAGGFRVDANIIGQSYKKAPITQADINRDLVERVAMGAATTEEAQAKRKRKALLFGGEVNSIADAQNQYVPLYMPRQGTPLQPGATVPTTEQNKPLRLLTHFEAAREMVDSGAPITIQGRSLIKRLYPDGVPEEALPELKQKLIDAAKLRVVHGD